MTLHRSLLPVAAIFALLASNAAAESITGAHYAFPVDRYGHFALGRPHEYARLTATTPHIGGTLRLYRRTGSKLVQVAALAGFSNHVYGSPELGLSAPVSIGGRLHLLVPDATRLQLRIIALAGASLVEAGRCALPAPMTGAIRVISPSEVSLGLVSGRQVIVLNDCRANRAP